MHLTQHVNELQGQELVEKLFNVHIENSCLSNTEDEKSNRTNGLQSEQLIKALHSPNL